MIEDEWKRSIARPELLQIAESVSRDKSIDQEIVIKAMEQAIQSVAKAISQVAGKDAAIIIITHYAWILKFLDKLDYVHVFARGQVLKTGDSSLADKLEAEGYEWALEEST